MEDCDANIFGYDDVQDGTGADMELNSFEDPLLDVIKTEILVESFEAGKTTTPVKKTKKKDTKMIKYGPKVDLKEYGKQDKETKSWCCTICGTRFSIVSRLINHLKRTHNIKIGSYDYKCSYCKMEFRNKNAKTTHTKRVHCDPKEDVEMNLKKYGNKDESGCWSCSMCGSIRALNHRFANHLKKFHDIKIGKFEHKCPHCEMGFRSKPAVRSHVKRLHADKVVNQKSPVVTSTERISENKNKVIKKNSTEESEHGKRNQHGTWLCNYCSAMYDQKSAFIRHLKSSHNVDVVDVKFDCPSCNEYFITQRALRDHLNTKHRYNDGEDEEQSLKKYGNKDEKDCWSCSMCDSRCTLNHKFVNHLKKFHDIKIGRFEYKCPHCEMEFNTNPAIRSHVKKKHAEIYSLMGISGKMKEDINTPVEGSDHHF